MKLIYIFCIENNAKAGTLFKDLIKSLTKKYKNDFLKAIPINSILEFKKILKNKNYLYEKKLIDKKDEIIFLEDIKNFKKNEIVLKIESFLTKIPIPIKKFSIIMINEKEIYETNTYEKASKKDKRPYLVIFNDANYGNFIVVPLTIGPLKDLALKRNYLNSVYLNKTDEEIEKLLADNSIFSNDKFINFVINKYKNRWIPIKLFKKDSLIKLDQPITLKRYTKYDWKNVELCFTFQEKDPTYKIINDKISELAERLIKK